MYTRALGIYWGRGSFSSIFLFFIYCSKKVGIVNLCSYISQIFLYLLAVVMGIRFYKYKFQKLNEIHTTQYLYIYKLTKYQLKYQLSLLVQANGD